MHTSAAAPESELRANAGVVLASMMGLAFSIATLGFTYSIGSFVKPLIDEFGWSRQDILGAQSFITVAVMVTSALAGWFADRHGVRRLIMVSQVLFGAGFFALALWLDSLTTLYVLYFLMAIGAGGTVGIGFARLLSQRFERQRGLALGVAMSGTGLCGFLVPPYATWAIEQFGWRGGYVALGLLPLCIALPLAWRYLHDMPAQAGSGRDTGGAVGTLASAPAPSTDTTSGASFAEALRDFRFWLMAIGLFTCSGVVTAFVTNIVPLLQEQGNAASQAALVASVFGISVLVGRVAVGALIDRYFAPYVGAALMFPAALAVLAMATLEPGFAGAAAIVFITGLAAGAEVDLMAYLCSRYFGLREYGRIFAGLYIAFAFGPGVLVPVFGRLRDVSGSYELGLYGIAAGIALFGVLLLLIGPYPRLAPPAQ
jgi:MFS family permease